jgi:hypothetical protein
LKPQFRKWRLGAFGEGIFVLAVADDQDAFSAALSHNELESLRSRIDGDE